MVEHKIFRADKSRTGEMKGFNLNIFKYETNASPKSFPSRSHAMTHEYHDHLAAAMEALAVDAVSTSVASTVRRYLTR